MLSFSYFQRKVDLRRHRETQHTDLRVLPPPTTPSHSHAPLSHPLRPDLHSLSHSHHPSIHQHSPHNGTTSTQPTPTSTQPTASSHPHPPPFPNSLHRPSLLPPPFGMVAASMATGLHPTSSLSFSAAAMAQAAHAAHVAQSGQTQLPSRHEGTIV